MKHGIIWMSPSSCHLKKIKPSGLQKFISIRRTHCWVTANCTYKQIYRNKSLFYRYWNKKFKVEAQINTSSGHCSFFLFSIHICRWRYRTLHLPKYKSLYKAVAHWIHGSEISALRPRLPSKMSSFFNGLTLARLPIIMFLWRPVWTVWKHYFSTAAPILYGESPHAKDNETQWLQRKRNKNQLSRHSLAKRKALSSRRPLNKKTT